MLAESRPRLTRLPFSWAPAGQPCSGYWATLVSGAHRATFVGSHHWATVVGYVHRATFDVGSIFQRCHFLWGMEARSKRPPPAEAHSKRPPSTACFYAGTPRSAH